ncbi:unnamed protein product [Polarella glacialis]|uniref:Endo-polygalacturonase n=1 Tax=Polarella glacialis TaxID=89957 RepID=A0A813FN66_POLGL|nr:unnamed protein product [Polarella glacialis]
MSYPQIAPLPSYGWSRDVNCFDESRLVNGTVVGVLRYSPVIGAFHARNVTLHGGGSIDGQGQSWYDFCNAHRLLAGRPRLVEFNNCSEMRVHSLVLRDSPFWTVHVVYSNSVHISSLEIYAPENARNTDGVNADSSRDVLIEDCFIADGVTLKSGKDLPGIALGLPLENVLVRNITSPKNSLGGVAIGSEMSGGIRNVTVIDSRFHGEGG